jgi:predicted transcriptional regulator of viral defense system
VLYSLLSQASLAKDGMRVAITAGVKRLMCQKHGIGSPQTIANALSKMTKEGILLRIETGVYMLNPFLIGKGDWKDIQKLRLGVGGVFVAKD